MKDILPLHINLLLEEKKNSVISEFTFSDEINPPLFFWPYINSVPRCSYSKRAFSDIFVFLTDLLQSNPNFINEFFTTNEHSLNQAMIILSEINSSDIHDISIPFDEYKRIEFYENHVNARYLKLIEGCFSVLIYPFSAIQRINRNASLEKFDIYNRVEELKKTKYNYLCEYYNNTIRNSIAHGSVKYNFTEILFKDHNKTINKDSNYFIQEFDSILDTCNGLMLGYVLFIFNQSSYFYKNKINIPIQIILEEIKERINSNYIEVISAIDHLVISEVKQLLIFLNAKRVPQSVLTNEILRSVNALLNYNINYDRYSFWIGGDKYYSGTVAFKTETLLNENNLSIDVLVKACDHYLIFFIPNKNIIQLFIKYTYYILEFLKASGKIIGQIKNTYKIEIRHNKIIKKQFKCSVESKIILSSDHSKIVIIKKDFKKIVLSTVKNARKKSKLSDGRIRPLGYIRISVYDSNIRTRNLSGLDKNLICTIDFLNLKKFRVINIKDGIIEKHGKYQIVWNPNYINSLKEIQV